MSVFACFPIELCISFAPRSQTHGATMTDKHDRLSLRSRLTWSLLKTCSSSESSVSSDESLRPASDLVDVVAWCCPASALSRCFTLACSSITSAFASTSVPVNTLP